MTIAEAERFYKADNKEYILSRNKDFLQWYSKQLKEGYTSYLDIADMQTLVEKIVLWYEIKLPFRYLDTLGGCFDTRFENIKEIANSMTVEQLRYRLYHKQLKTLDCYYRTGWGGLSSNNELVVCMNIKKKNAQHGEFEGHMITATADKGKLKGWCEEELDKYLGVEAENLDLRALLQLFEQKGNTEYDYSDLEQCVKRNNTDIMLRYYLFNMVSLGLLYSQNVNPEAGLYRAKQFISNFNDYYGLSLTSEYLDEIVAIDYSPEKGGCRKKTKKSLFDKKN